ncbi:hypothetical protein ACIQ6K_34105 [Streptomyces sp. NPDC096354]
MTQPIPIRRPQVLRVLDAYSCIGGAARGVASQFLALEGTVAA